MARDNQPLPGRLNDPTLTLFDGAGSPLFSNDDWMNSPQIHDIMHSGARAHRSEGIRHRGHAAAGELHRHYARRESTRLGSAWWNYTTSTSPRPPIQGTFPPADSSRRATTCMIGGFIVGGSQDRYGAGALARALPHAPGGSKRVAGPGARIAQLIGHHARDQRQLEIEPGNPDQGHWFGAWRRSRTSHPFIAPGAGELHGAIVPRQREHHRCRARRNLSVAVAQASCPPKAGDNRRLPLLLKGGNGTGGTPVRPRLRRARATVLRLQMRPVDFDALFSGEAIVEKKFLIPAAVLVQQPGHLHVETAVFCNIEDPPSRHQRIASSPAAVFESRVARAIASSPSGDQGVSPCPPSSPRWGVRDEVDNRVPIRTW